MAKRKRKQKKQQPAPWLWMALAGVVVLVIAGVLLAGKGGGSQAASLPPEISVQQAYQKYEQGTFLLDVRTQPEWDEFHAPKAVLIPLDELPNRLSELPKDQEIVVICRSGNRSAVATDILRQNGFNATSVAGGMNAWRAAGYPVTP